MNTPRPHNHKKGGLLTPLRRQKGYDYEVVESVVANTTGVDREALRGKYGSPEESEARHLLWFFWRTSCHMSQSQIAAEAGIAEGSVKHGLNRIRQRFADKAGEEPLRETRRIITRKLELRHRRF